MKRTLIIILFIVCIVSSFLLGAYYATYRSPVMIGYLKLKDKGMSDKEIEQAFNNIPLYTQKYLDNTESDHLTGAIMGVNTLKALKEENSSDVETYAIMQIMLFYDFYIDDSTYGFYKTGDDDSSESLESKVVKDIEGLSLEFPALKSRLDETKNKES